MLLVDGSVRYSLGDPSSGRTRACVCTPDGVLMAVLTNHLAICSASGTVRQLCHVPIDLGGFDGPCSMVWRPIPVRTSHTSPHTPQRAYRLVITCPTHAIIVEVGQDAEKPAGWLDWLLGEEGEESSRWTMDDLPDYTPRVVATIRAPTHTDASASGAGLPAAFTCAAATYGHILLGRSDAVLAAATWDGKLMYEAELKGVSTDPREYRIVGVSASIDGACMCVSFASGTIMSGALEYEPFVHIPQASIRIVCGSDRKTAWAAHAEAVLTGPAPARAAAVTATSLARVEDGTFVLAVGHSDGTVEIYRSQVYTPRTPASPVPGGAAAAPSRVIRSPASAAPPAPQDNHTSLAAAVSRVDDASEPAFAALHWTPVIRFSCAHASSADAGQGMDPADTCVRGLQWRTQSAPRSIVVPISYDTFGHFPPTTDAPHALEVTGFIDVLPGGPGHAVLAVLAGSQHVAMWGIHFGDRALTLLEATTIDGAYAVSPLPSPGTQLARSGSQSLMTWANGAFSLFIGLPEACPAVAAKDGLVYMSDSLASSGASDDSGTEASADSSDDDADDEDAPSRPQQPHVARIDVADGVAQGMLASGRCLASTPFDLSGSGSGWAVTAEGIFTLHGIERLSAAPLEDEDHGAADSDTDYSFFWDAAHGSHHYVPANAPIRTVAASPDASALAVTGSRGAAIYYRRRRQWRVFSTPTQEAGVHAQALAWVGDRALVILNRTRPEETAAKVPPPAIATLPPAAGVFHLIGFPRTHLDTSMQLCSVPLYVPVGAEPVSMMSAHTDVWQYRPSSHEHGTRTCARTYWCAVLMKNYSHAAWGGMMQQAAHGTGAMADASAQRAEEPSTGRPVLCVYRMRFQTSNPAKSAGPLGIRKGTSFADVKLLASADPSTLEDGMPLDEESKPTLSAWRDPAMVYGDETSAAPGKPHQLRQVAALRSASSAETLMTTEDISIRPAAGIQASPHALLRLPALFALEGIAAIHMLGRDVIAPAPAATGEQTEATKPAPAPEAWRSLLPDFVIQTRKGSVYILHGASATVWPLYVPRLRPLRTPASSPGGAALATAAAPPRGTAAVLATVEPRAYGSVSASTIVLIHDQASSFVYTRGTTTLGHAYGQDGFGSLASCRPLLGDVVEHRAHKIRAASLLWHLGNHGGAAVVVHAGARVPSPPAAPESADAARSGADDTPSILQRRASMVPARGVRVVPTLQLVLRAAILRGLSMDMLATSADPLSIAFDIATAALSSSTPMVHIALRALLHDAVDVDSHDSAAGTLPMSPVSTAAVARLRRAIGSPAHRPPPASTSMLRANGLDIDVLSGCGSGTLSVLRPLAEALRVYMEKKRLPLHVVFGPSEYTATLREVSSPAHASEAGSAYLEAVLALLRRLDLLLDVVAAVGRTIEEERLPALFPASGVPRELFRAALRRAAALSGGVGGTAVHNAASIRYLRIAASFMLLVQEYAWRTRMPDARSGMGSPAPLSARANASARADTDSAGTYLRPTTQDAQTTALSIVSENMEDAQALFEAVGLPSPVAVALVGARPTALARPGTAATAAADPEVLVDAIKQAIGAACDADPRTPAALMHIVESAAGYCERLRAVAAEITSSSSSGSDAPRSSDMPATPRERDDSAKPSSSWGIVGTVAYYLGFGSGAAEAPKAKGELDVPDPVSDPTLRALRECTIELLASSSASVRRRPGGAFGIALAKVNLDAAVAAQSHAVPEDLLNLARSPTGARTPEAQDLLAVTNALDKAREQQASWLRAQLRDAPSSIAGVPMADVVAGSNLEGGDILVSVEDQAITGKTFEAAVHALDAAPKETRLDFARVVSVPALQVLRVLMPKA